MTIRLLSVRTGRIEAFGPKGEPSAIAKQAARGRLQVGRLGIAGDEQADKRHHGGPDKALHHYPHEHYLHWQTRFPERSDRFVAGGFGENISTQGVTEADACLGDIYHLGSALIQVSQGRKPCWKLNTRFGTEAMARVVHETGRTGWYYRVIEAGEAGPEDELRLIDRPLPDWSVRRLYDALHRSDSNDRDGLVYLAGCPILAIGWRERAKERLSSHP
jgi:MOSC domain-containing protein YiiM